MNRKAKLLVSAAIAAVLLGSVAFAVSRLRPASTLGHGSPFSSTNYVNVIGSKASPKTLTTSYNDASSTVELTTGLPNIAVLGSYVPHSYGSNIYILIERSVDNGVTFFPYSTITPENTDTLVNTSGTSSTNGSPFIIPGNALSTAASGTAIGFSFDLPIAADYLRFSVKENTTSTAGTVYIQTVLTSN